MVFHCVFFCGNSHHTWVTPIMLGWLLNYMCKLREFAVDTKSWLQWRLPLVIALLPPVISYQDCLLLGVTPITFTQHTVSRWLSPNNHSFRGKLPNTEMVHENKTWVTEEKVDKMHIHWGCKIFNCITYLVYFNIMLMMKGSLPQWSHLVRSWYVCGRISLSRKRTFHSFISKLLLHLLDV